MDRALDRARRLALTLACALLLLGPAACKRKADPDAAAPPGPAGPPQPAKIFEHEPNDAQHPQLLPDRSIVIGTIDPGPKGAPDDDWYRVAPGAGQLFALHIELAQGVPAPAVEPAAGARPQPQRQPLDATIEVLDRDRNRLVRTRASASSSALLPAVACLEGCLIHVSGAVPADYRLTVIGGPPVAGVELEPNDRAVDATAIPAGASVQATYTTAEDEDWFKVLAAAPKPGQFLRVELSGVEGIRPEIELRALDDGALLATFRAPLAGEGILLRDLALPQPSSAADLPIALPAQPALAPTSAPLSTAPPTPTTSPSTSPTATPAEAAAAATSTPDPPPSAPAAAPAPAPAPTPPPAPPPSPAASAPLAPSGYYLVVRALAPPAARGQRPPRPSRPQVPYTLSTTLEQGPAELEVEPNDDPSHATPLARTRAGFLSPAGDVDWYRVHSDQPVVARVELSPLERADTELSVWVPSEKPGDKPTLLARSNEGGVREGELIPAVGLPAGDALIKVESAQREFDGKKVRDGEDRQNAYQLTVALSPDDGGREREPNDDLARAQVLPLPIRVTGTIWPHRDVDLFRFHVDEGRPPVSIRVSAVRGVDLLLALLQLKPGKGGKPAADIIGTSDARRGEGEESILKVPLKPGDYAVELSSPRGKDASATQTYTLTVE